MVAGEGCESNPRASGSTPNQTPPSTSKKNKARLQLNFKTTPKIKSRPFGPFTPPKIMSQDDSFSVLAEAIKKLAESSSNQAAATLVNINTPKFAGSVGEDLGQFLHRFEKATVSLTESLRCSILIKSLIDDAAVWARNSEELAEAGNDWPALIRLLKSRFDNPEANLVKLEKLSKTKFNPATKTLLAYVENFVELYKSVYPHTQVSSLLEHLSLKLPPDVKYQLRILDPYWLNYTSLNELYALIKRAEGNLSLQQAQQTSQNDSMKEIIDALKTLVDSKSKASKTETLALAAVSTDYSRPNPSTQGNNYPRLPYNTNNHRANYNQYSYRNQEQSNYNKRPYQSDNRNSYNYPKKPYYQQQSQLRQQDPNRRLDQQSRGQAPRMLPETNPQTSELQLAYDNLHGRPPYPCSICKGNSYHWMKHCPLNLAKANGSTDQANPPASK